MPKGVYDRSGIKRPNKRGEILAAATKIYAHYGFEGATIERMAAAAGVSKSLVLEHFGSKKELVKAIAENAVRGVMEKLRPIDETPGLTLPRREALIHQLVATERETWCLILGTVLVPDFQFPLRREIVDYQQATCEAVVRRHLDELRDPTREGAYAYAYGTTCLHVGYILSSREENYHRAMAWHLDAYLRPAGETPAV